MRDLDLTSLRYFVAVCETGNITRAAEREHLVVSAISKRLAQLELGLGTPLLERQRRGVTPTPAGELLLEQSRALLSTAARVAQDVASFGSGVRGRVRLLATVSCIAEALPDDVAAFMRQAEHREIQVDIEETLGRDIVRLVREGGASIGILWDSAELQGLQTAPYRVDHLSVAVHRGHPLARRRDCSFEETLAFDHVGLQASSAVNAMLQKAAAASGTALRYRAQVSNFEAALRVVSARLGITVIPLEVAAVHAPALGLRIVPLRDGWARRRFTICYRDRGSMSKAALKLLDFLVTAGRDAPAREN
ncbi:LysR family transcriptional regulator [Pseudorhodoferax sp.]|uniref:LysR family transcriptional regulator n=1 Tax=Pseudorhodoferax sp. TaxID=1993553 RepID=UPI002DD66E5A|nr:LysR family transcriptional regulator [Pseudorhodoferax sp.]